MQVKQEKFVVDSTKTIISSQSETKKTAEFVAQTKYLLDIDFFISKIAGVLTKNFDTLFSNNKPSNENAAFKVDMSACIATPEANASIAVANP